MGSFDTKEEAALEYDRAALKYHGEHAVFNFNKAPVDDDSFTVLDHSANEAYSIENTSVSGTETQLKKEVTDLQNDQSNLVSMLMEIRSMPSTGSSHVTEPVTEEPGHTDHATEDHMAEDHTAEDHTAEDTATAENATDSTATGHRYNTRHVHISTLERTTPPVRPIKRRKTKKTQEGDSDDTSVPNFESLLKAGSESEDSATTTNSSSLSPYVAVPNLLNATDK